MLALLGLLLGCGGSEPGGGRDPVERFVAAAERAGWTVAEGALVPSSMAPCCDRQAFCTQTDPAAPYAAWALPPGPGEEAPDPDGLWMWGPAPEGTHRDLALDPAEALVWIGTLPPEVGYLGLRSYLASRVDPAGERVTVLGALGPPLNQARIAAERGVAVEALWGEPLVVVSTADRRTEIEVLRWLEEAGQARPRIHLDRIPPDRVRLGTDPQADRVTVLLTLLDPADPQALEAWWEDPGTLLRLSPTAPASADPHPADPLPPAGTGVGEIPWSLALDDLEAAILATHAPSIHLVRTSAWEEPDPWACLEALDCEGRTADRLRSRSPEFTLAGEEFAVAFGVNPVRTGKASRTTLSVHNTLTGTAAAWLDGPALVGTARPYLGDANPWADDLYAVILDRDCDRWLAPCLELPDACPGPPPADPMIVVGSDYLEPATGTGPDPEERLPPRVVKFFADLGG